MIRALYAPHNWRYSSNDRFSSKRCFLQTAVVKWVRGEEFAATLPSGNAVSFDGDRAHKGGGSPMEMLLAALGACSSVDVVVILAKKRQQLVSLSVEVSGERAAQPPMIWTKIDMLYRLSGKLEDKAVRDAIELSQTKYCSVAAMLGKAAKISYRYEITPAEP